MSPPLCSDPMFPSSILQQKEGVNATDIFLKEVNSRLQVIFVKF